jgi:hypothetical protein
MRICVGYTTVVGPQIITADVEWAERTLRVPVDSKLSLDERLVRIKEVAANGDHWRNELANFAAKLKLTGDPGGRDQITSFSPDKLWSFLHWVRTELKP